jgi:hypothetical protein
MAEYLMRGRGSSPDTPFEKIDTIKFYLENYYAFEQERNDEYRSHDGGYVYITPKKIQYFGLTPKLERILKLLAEPYDYGRDPDLADVTKTLAEMREEKATRL